MAVLLLCVAASSCLRSMAGVVASLHLLGLEGCLSQLHFPCFLAMIPALLVPSHVSFYLAGGRRRERAGERVGGGKKTEGAFSRWVNPTTFLLEMLREAA